MLMLFSLLPLTNILLWLLYCLELGFDPTDMHPVKPESTNGLNLQAYGFEALVLVLTLAMPTLVALLLRMTDTRTLRSATWCRVLLWSTLITVSFLPIQSAVIASTKTLHTCLPESWARGYMSTLAFTSYWIIYPLYVLAMPPIGVLSRILLLRARASWQKRAVAQEELDVAYRLPPLETVAHLYDLVVLLGICRFYFTFSAAIMFTTLLTVVLMKWAIQYNVRFQSAAPFEVHFHTIIWYAFYTLVLLWFNINVSYTRDPTITGDESSWVLGVGIFTPWEGGYAAHRLAAWPIFSYRASNFLLVVSIPHLLSIIGMILFRPLVQHMILYLSPAVLMRKMTGSTFEEISKKHQGYVVPQQFSDHRIAKLSFADGSEVDDLSPLTRDSEGLAWSGVPEEIRVRFVSLLSREAQLRYLLQLADADGIGGIAEDELFIFNRALWRLQQRMGEFHAHITPRHQAEYTKEKNHRFFMDLAWLDHRTHSDMGELISVESLVAFYLRFTQSLDDRYFSEGSALILRELNACNLNA